jgi:anti-sigma B factor antagonist
VSRDLIFRLLHRDGTRAVLQVSGPMDLDTCPSLEQALADLVDNGSPRLVLDLHEVDFCDSSGINSLLRALAHAKESSGSLALAATSPQVQHLLDLIGLGAVITSYPSVTAALRSAAA